MARVNDLTIPVCARSLALTHAANRVRGVSNLPRWNLPLVRVGPFVVHCFVAGGV